MWVKSIQIQNVKSFTDSGDIVLSRGINILLAPNNAGKTTVLRCIYALQQSSYQSGGHFPFAWKRFGAVPQVTIALENINAAVGDQLRPNKIDPNTLTKAVIQFDGKKDQLRGNVIGQSEKLFQPLAHNGIQSWILPFLGRRKSGDLREEVGSNYSRLVDEINPHLYAKIDRMIGLDSDGSFRKACEDILQLPIGTIQSDHGKTAGVVLDNRGTAIAPVAAMGEGSRNVLQLLVDLWGAEDSLFLIEEPENDIHPGALKKLLKAIAERSTKNQFIISTHSNIVAKYLGSVPNTKLFRLNVRTEGRLPTSTITEVENTPEGRLGVLEELGYDLFDFDLWKGYLVLEESSAERILNEILIPAFQPELRNCLKLIASGGISKVEARFEDLQRLFVFIHTSPAYHDRGWVLVDGGSESEVVVQKLRSTFKTWDSSHFQTLRKADFELYYPDRFQVEISEILKLDKQQKRAAKKLLLHKVLEWAAKNPAEAVAEFRTSAPEVIQFLDHLRISLIGDRR